MNHEPAYVRDLAPKEKDTRGPGARPAWAEPDPGERQRGPAELAGIAMLGLAGLLTFLWLVLLAWGVVRLLEAMLS